MRRVPMPWLLGVLAIALVPLTIHGVRILWAHDPFARFFGSWSDPFGGNIGSLMLDTNVGVYDGANRTVSFHADRLDVRRDQQFVRLTGIREGKVYQNNQPTTSFGAARAEIEQKDETIRINDGAWLEGKDFRFEAPRITISGKRENLFADSGVHGTYKKGTLKADTLLIGFAGKPSKATQILWTGPIDLQGQGTRKLIIRADKSEYLSNPDREIHTNVEVIDQDAMMRARKMTWDKEPDIITLEGDCEYHGPDAILAGPKVVIYRKEKRAVVTDNVLITVKPEKEKGATTLQPAQPVLPPGLKQPGTTQKEIEDELRSGKSFRKYPVVITCTKVEYFYAKGKKKALMTGSPKARQVLRAGSWREISAPLAIYEEEKELLTLISSAGGRDVRMKNSVGDDLTAEMLVISTVEGNEKMTGTRIAGSMKVTDEDAGPPPPRKT